MLIKFLILFSIVTPLIGIYLMETGGVSPAVGVGYPNGASLAYLFFALGILLTIRVLVGRRFFSKEAPLQTGECFPYRSSQISLAIIFGFLLITIFAFGGLNVLTGQVGKVEFRTNLGPLGFIGFLILKFFTPAIFAFLCLQHVRSGQNKRSKKIVLISGLMTFLIGLSWGFKTTGVLAIFPGLVFLMWRTGLAGLLRLIFFISILILATATLFSGGEEVSFIAEFLLRRLSIMQGDVAWYIWDEFINGVVFPSYVATITPVLGDRMFSLLTGVTLDQPKMWVEQHYGLLITYLTDYPIAAILDGHNVTGTIFAEGIIAGGRIGLAFFSVIGGLVIAIFYTLLRRALERRHDYVASILACYFVFYINSWIVAGGVVTLFHISVIIGVAVTWILLKIIFD